ncbi:fatty-acyl-CoA synthase [Pseudomonas taetrolens]|uniref:Fatty-acyl-CoA synthase n=1 Tax=Pseudomonas taetrolens TaxID=47884 RepID=A0A0J6GSR2_PSETA|nr:long-chain-acyl-CoA synthetase [Pseudomonas taetrolens]KMM85418.1 long-chain acyl-CoA synthetase [Pseudomonas taetrolens]SEC30604.1 fatty-acyl-CoA synthase [Pseudomonas taetrolens]SQF86321.1 long-chain-acyl-CoA synthetase [Pseudomonas taetrolens]VEH49398.1 long-chain-acyl-CoA synthetase [Pseudomonas taetrolens]
MNDMSRINVPVASRQQPVPREQTQALLDLRSAASAQIKPADLYTLADRLEAQAQSAPERTFLIYGTQTFSYGEVDAQAHRMAHVFYSKGLRPGDVCAIAMENRPGFFFSWFGLVKLGVVVAFINTQVSGKPLVHALESTAAKAVVVGEECLANLRATDDVPDVPWWLIPDLENPWDGELPTCVDGGFAAQLAQAPATPFPREVRAAVTAESTTLLIFTSGTTGLPKAARYSHMRWMSSGDVMEVTLGATCDDVFYCCLPLYHGAAATSVTSTALRVGASIVVRRKFSVREFWQDVRRNQITVFQYIGEICRYLLNQPPVAGEREHSLRYMLGAGLTPESWQRWLERFGPIQVFEGWGATEANANLINVDNYVGSCGRVPDWSRTNLRLVRYDVESDTHPRDEQGFYQLCQPGEVGEAMGFIVNHPQMGGGRFEGYTSDAATESKIRRDVFQPGDAYWSSGDLLRYDDDGYFYFVDRIGDTFRWKSENVSTLEVADTLSDLPGLELINVYGVQVPEHEGRAGMAAILMQPGQNFDPKAFYDLTEARLPRYAAPMFVRVSAAADLTSTFKLRKVDLQRQGYAPGLFADPLFVRDESTRTYQPYSLQVLARAGLPPFVSPGHE